MADKRTRERRREKRQRAADKRAALELEKDVEELEAAAEEPLESEELEKDYAEPMMVAPPTSFAEVDAARKALEVADQIRRETWTLEEIVYNIAYSAMTPDGKAKAIAKAGTDFSTRLKAASKLEKSVEDMELLQLQALLATDARETSLVVKSVDLLSEILFPPHPGSKNALRKEIKAKIKQLEHSDDETLREGVGELIHTARETGLGAQDQIVIEKDLSGTWRAVLFPSNNFRDRDGEIISQTAHESWVEWINKNMDVAPVFATWHKPGTARQHPLDFIAYDNGFLLASLPLTEVEAATLLKMQAQYRIGLSIGGLALERDKTDPSVITKYVMFEVSDLPLESAANPFTDIELINKEAQMKPEQMLAYLTGMVGEERAKQVIEKMALNQSTLRKAEIEEKEVQAATPPPEPPAAAQDAPPEALNMDAIIKRVGEEFGMQQLSDALLRLQAEADKVPVLEGLIKELTASKEETLAEMIQPAAGKTLSWMDNRPSQNTTNILKKDVTEDEELKKSIPETLWLSQATHTQPAVS